MKVERINDNQIKVIMSERDLEERNITLLEVAYGSEKGQELFEEVMNQARENYDFQFDEKIPLIIEAIPMSKTELTLIISKVSKLEDIEQNFSFFPQNTDEHKFIKKSSVEKKTEDCKISISAESKDNLLIFMFNSLNDVVQASLRIYENYNGENMLYKLQSKYYLIAHPDLNLTETAFIKLERVLCEYGKKQVSTSINKMHILEFGEKIACQAVKILAEYLG